MSDTPGTVTPRRRGRPARIEEAAPTGYRATRATRRQLEMARQFTGHGSLQAIIDAAVHGYLTGLTRTTPAYRSALASLDASLLANLDQSNGDSKTPSTH